MKLGDFGIAFAYERTEHTAAGVVSGKAAYMAPEQLTGGSVDGRTDVFALARTIHRALVGRSPLSDDDAIAGLPRGEHVTLDPAIPHDVARPLGEARDGDRDVASRDGDGSAGAAFDAGG